MLTSFTLMIFFVWEGRRLRGENLDHGQCPFQPIHIREFGSSRQSLWDKALVNEDTLLRTHCCPWCFLGCANWETFFADAKCFWTKSETFFVSRTQNLSPQQMLRAWATRETFVSATMCRRLPEPMRPYNKYMLFAGWEIRIVKNCDLGPEVTVFNYTDRP